MASTHAAQPLKGEPHQSVSAGSIPSSPLPVPSDDYHSRTEEQNQDYPDSDLPPLPTSGSPSLPSLPTSDDDSFLHVREPTDNGLDNDESAMGDREMKRRLMDIESSFIPEMPTQLDVPPLPSGTDDTYLFGGTPGRTGSLVQSEGSEGRAMSTAAEGKGDADEASSFTDEPPTPAGAYKTPAVDRFDPRLALIDDSLDAGTSTSEPSPSSPAAQAAQRNNSRVASEARLDSKRRSVPAKNEKQVTTGAQEEVSDGAQRPTSSASTVKAPDFTQMEENSSFTDDHELSMENITIQLPPLPPSSTSSENKRPTFLQRRSSSHRSSVSSFTNRSDLSGDGSLGADYALQSGGAAPRSIGQTRSSMGLSRLPSLGSIASSVSGYSDSNPWDKSRSVGANSISGLPEHGLGRLDEEVLGSETPPETPRAPNARPLPPTDTVIARHVQDIQVPDTVAREYRAQHPMSPDKRHMATPFTRSKHNLTLKEQNSKIDKLSKENFDLKLKIHFLDQALQNRSDEGVKDMISKNVQLQTDLANEKKENQSLRKKVRDLERKLKSQEDGLASKDTTGVLDEESMNDARQAELEEEIIFLRERLESSETTIEQLRQDNLHKEVEKRRMAEYIRSMGEKNSPESSAGINEAIGMWKEEVEDERARRERAEAEAEKLRDEVFRLQEAAQQPHQQSTTSHHTRNSYSITRRNLLSHVGRSNSGSDSNDLVAMSTGGTSSTLVDQLLHENSELRRDLGAQTSMLTSRNRERERLQQEIESLKLSVRRGDVGSVAGDSIFERSISRNHQRSVSRASGGTRVTQVSDAERDDYESKLASLRDELSQTKLQFKELDDQLNGHLDLLEQTEAQVRELNQELELQTQDLQALQAERDEALEILQDKEQECEELRQQALETIQRLEDEIERKEQESGRLVTELQNLTEDFNALQQEMKNVSESLVQLEDDQSASLRKIQNLEAELDDANAELVRQDKVLTDEKSKTERLEVQLESAQNETDFLREEQEGDKIKIGELETELLTARHNVKDSKERFRELEERLAEERRQRDILDTREKQEVDKIISDLNSQLGKLKEDNRALRKNLSGKEVEATTLKQRLEEFESNLRDTLGNLNGSRSSLFKDIAKLQRNYDAALQELNDTKTDLAEKDRLLRNRDALLEDTGMETRRLSDLLERERQARRQDQVAFDAAKRGQQSVSRSIQQHEAKIIELETLRSNDRRKLVQVESHYKEQLVERNNLLYALWNRLSTLCGPEWARNHTVINGELTSMELISKNISGFNKNMITAVKTIEGIIAGFRTRIKNIEKDLLRDYQTLEHTLDVRVKRLDQLEKMAIAQRQSIGRPSTIRGGMIDTNSAEVSKLRSENKSLRSEIQTLRQISTSYQPPPPANNNTATREVATPSPTSAKRASMAQTLLRHHSTSAVEGVQNNQQSGSHPYPQSVGLQPSEQKWIHRLKELERRLKAEREARLLDRSGARKRLEQKVEENADLRAMLEREREKKEAEFGVPAEGSNRGSGRVSRVGSSRVATPREEEEMY